MFIALIYTYRYTLGTRLAGPTGDCTGDFISLQKSPQTSPCSVSDEGFPVGRLRGHGSMDDQVSTGGFIMGTSVFCWALVLSPMKGFQLVVSVAMVAWTISIAREDL